MRILARLMYRALVWKERQRARLAARSGPEEKRSASDAHLATGRQGESLVYWYLRQAGYTLVARNRPSRYGAGELDLIGWDGPVLTFIEVKTRTSAVGGPPESAVTLKQRKRIASAAKVYVRRLKPRPTYRFDIASVTWDAKAGWQVRLIKDAFKE